MWIYIGASFPRKNEARELANILRADGHYICSSWMGDAESVYDNGKADKAESIFEAEQDFDDIANCHIFIMISGDTFSRGGRHTELGIALALHKRVIVFGPPESVFCSHGRVTVVQDIVRLKEALI